MPEPDSSVTTSIALCGYSLHGVVNGRPITAVRGRDARALLAYLLLHRHRAISRPELIGAVWPADQPRDRLNSLSHALARARDAIGSGAISSGEMLELNLEPGAEVD